MSSMTSPEYGDLVAVLARNWWAIAIRGVLGILFGLVALFLPGATMLSLVLLFAAYAFVDGVFGIIAAVYAARQHERWSLLVLGPESRSWFSFCWSPSGRFSPV
jgi:uncharacterized membrane protein HdeD (DUF308 family)